MPEFVDLLVRVNQLKLEDGKDSIFASRELQATNLLFGLLREAPGLWAASKATKPESRKRKRSCTK